MKCCDCGYECDDDYPSFEWDFHNRLHTKLDELK